MTKRLLSRSLVWFLVITLIPFALPGTVMAKDPDKKQQQCVNSATGAGVVTGACWASLTAAGPTCGAATALAAFDAGVLSFSICGVVVWTAALSCGVTVPVVIKTLADCFF